MSEAAIIICRECEKPFMHISIVGRRPRKCQRCKAPLLAMMPGWCDECGCIHDEADRLRRLARVVPAETWEILLAMEHIYAGRERTMWRDMRRLDATREQLELGRRVKHKQGSLI